METRDKILSRLQEMNISPKRSLGQNFLVSENVIQQIISQIKSFKPKTLIEVGPGLGSLTEGLLQIQIPTTLIELDSEFASYWRSVEAQNKLLSVIEADALQVNWAELLPQAESVVLVANLPYQIGGRLVIERALGPERIDKMVLMFQKEVAQRLTAQPRTKDYGFLSVVAQAAFQMRMLLEAGPRDFYPAPNVSSRVVIFERKKNSIIDNDFVKFVKAAFSQRRKFMVKSFPQEKEALLSALRQLGYNEKVRAEEISVEMYLALYKLLRQ